MVGIMKNWCIFTGAHHCLHLLLLGCFYVMAPLIDRLAEGQVLLSLPPIPPSSHCMYTAVIWHSAWTAPGLPQRAAWLWQGPQVYIYNLIWSSQASSLEIIEQRSSEGGLWNCELHPSTGACEELTVCCVGRLQTLKKKCWPDFNTSSENV